MLRARLKAPIIHLGRAFPAPASSAEASRFSPDPRAHVRISLLESVVVEATPASRFFCQVCSSQTRAPVHATEPVSVVPQKSSLDIATPQTASPRAQQLSTRPHSPRLP